MNWLTINILSYRCSSLCITLVLLCSCASTSPQREPIALEGKPSRIGGENIQNARFLLKKDFSHYSGQNFGVSINLLTHRHGINDFLSLAITSFDCDEEPIAVLSKSSSKVNEAHAAAYTFENRIPLLGDWSVSISYLGRRNNDHIYVVDVNGGEKEVAIAKKIKFIDMAAHRLPISAEDIVINE